ncbi:hypothetical protein [Mesorhizobium sp. M0909]|uniref:hypothetical protein n=1 Tax=Mesorhizobium sp. M0909 TaxID=2957024 RepID=UPI00333D8B92
MSLPDIDFSRIRIHRGAQSNAFEELCCQLANDEPADGRIAFDRKGPSGDGGVECFATLADGSEIGWQVKYYTLMPSMLTSLSKSLETALVKHPKMTRFIACFPIDLSDSRRDGVKTSLSAWGDWCSEHIAAAAAAARTIEIERWDAHEIKRRLIESNPKSAGRIAFWFDEQLLTAEWLSKKFERTKALLGKRYSPESHIDLPIRKSILALAHDPLLADALLSLAQRIDRTWRDVGMPADAELALQRARDFACGLELAARGYPRAVPVDKLRILGSLALEEVLSWHQKVEGGIIDIRRLVSNLAGAVSAAHRELALSYWDLIQNKSLLVLGEGGTGKSHLLADACAHQLDAGRPAIMIPSGSLADGDPWQQIMRFLDVAPHMQVSQFLGAINAFGEASGARTILAIDALNEQNGQAIWPTGLPGFLHDLTEFPHIAVVLSCRTTYETSVVPTDLSETTLPRITHGGFSAEQALAYIAQRGVNLADAPNPIEELSTPLFLRIVCDTLVSSIGGASTTVPRGLSAMFRLYLNAVAENVNQALDIDRRLQLVPKALAALAEEMAATGRSELTWMRANALLANIYRPAGGKRDLLFQLENEGLLTGQPGYSDDDPDIVRFTFERLSDYVVAEHLIGAATQAEPGSFATKGAVTDPNAPYGRLLQASAPIFWGVEEAMAVLLPERVGVELPDVVGDEAWSAHDAFEKSLFTRAPGSFSDRTWALIDEAGGDALRLETMIALATEPGHAKNFHHTHQVLFDIPMPERDAVWSIHVASSTQTNHFISWAMIDRLSLSAERARLTALLLTWHLTTSSRAIRDTATKALVSILADRPAVAIEMWERFEDANDPYVVERLLAAIYGAALQGRWDKTLLARLAIHLFTELFAAGTQPANILVRDHARGFIRFAQHNGALPSDIDLGKLDAAGGTPWPLEPVSDETIATYTVTYEGGSKHRDDITSSCMDGDFARYQIDRVVSKWSMAPRGAEHFPTVQELRDQWLGEFLKDATPEMIDAHEALIEAISAKDSAKPHDRAAEAKVVEARQSFRIAAGETVYEDWRARAEYWRKLAAYQTMAPANGPAMFNLGWARRWICKRAHDFGWSKALHGEFDRAQGSGRMTHSKERIGKKYQWLALYELLARLEDHVAPLPSLSDRKRSPCDQRNMDPSMLRSSTSDDGWRDFHTPAFWIPTAPRFGPETPEQALAWLDAGDDVIDGAENIEVADPRTGIAWLVLRGFEQWRSGQPNIEVEAWRRLACLVVKKQNRKRILELIATSLMTANDAVPSSDMDLRAYLGEYPWAWNKEDDDWVKSWQPDWNPGVRGIDVLPTTAEYTAERGNYDESISENLTIHLPAVWLMRELNARLSDGRSIEYLADGEAIFMDPSIKGSGRSAALVRKDAFLDLLAKQGLTPIWVISGEKRADTPMHSSGFGGCYSFSTPYILTGSKLTAQERLEKWEQPSSEQRRIFMGETDTE